jgi:transketolase
MTLGTVAGLEMGKPTRDAFGEALRDLAAGNSRIVVVDGDVHNSTRTEWFANEYPDRFFNVGIAESNLVGVAAGLAACGKIPVAASFAAFLLCNAYDQIRMSVAFPKANVKLVGSHAGISIGEDGPSQMGIEDVSLACSLPGVTVIVPADEHTTRAATAAMIDHDGPTFLRVGRSGVPVIYDAGVDVRLGRAIETRAGSDVTIIANGLMVSAALDAATLLERDGIQARVLDMHTVKPLDREAVVSAATETAGIVVAEEHLRHGGLGSAVAMAAAESAPCPIRFVDIGDTFARSGGGDELLEAYGLTAERIATSAREIAGRG